MSDAKALKRFRQELLFTSKGFHKNIRHILFESMSRGSRVKEVESKQDFEGPVRISGGHKGIQTVHKLVAVGEDEKA